MKRLPVILVMGWAMQIGFVSAMVDYPEEIPFVPTPIEVVDQMLELAEVKKGDIVYDLGSGDGRIVIRAAKKYGARGIGIEMDQTLIDKS
jgi:predicted RNA methylase